ncbi:hypothetical protein BU16DRAFT_367773 [Lophium mytilinum]|uniref:DUF7730 domain-containing protein n=1 Tax=Lophium mytilinum TaxID=390894 RepID=A0A6A6QWT9_9PEZI|nr:hypothetical protein BU16DRAFT_367773 [Lophium mytilinum]
MSEIVEGPKLGIREEFRRQITKEFDERSAETLRRKRALTDEFSAPPPIETLPGQQSSKGIPGPSASAVYQSSSPLFQKLSAELRVLIYREALCSSLRLHLRSIYSLDGAPSSVRKYRFAHASSKVQRIVFTPCSIVGCRPQDSISHIRVGEKNSLLPLLLTCRAIYLEAIELLYSGNAFHFGSRINQLPTTGTIEYVLMFSQSVLPHRLASIREISLCSAVPIRDFHKLEDWEQMWNVIAGILKLRVLNVELVRRFVGGTDREEQERALFAPLKRVRCNAEFTLRLKPLGLEHVLKNDDTFVIKNPGVLDRSSNILCDRTWVQVRKA